MSPHQERVVTEEAELTSKLTKLQDFITNSPVFKSLDQAERDRLDMQEHYMRKYQGVLQERIVAFRSNQ